MNAAIEFNSLLVPVDFSPPSDAALERAISLASGDTPFVILLHVIDPSLVQFAVKHGWGTAEEVTKRMREEAQEKLSEYQQRIGERIDCTVIVSEGLPFLEIIRKSEDFAVDAIVMGKVGARGSLQSCSSALPPNKFCAAAIARCWCCPALLNKQSQRRGKPRGLVV